MIHLFPKNYRDEDYRKITDLAINKTIKTWVQYAPGVGRSPFNKYFLERISKQYTNIKTINIMYELAEAQKQLSDLVNYISNNSYKKVLINFEIDKFDDTDENLLQCLKLIDGIRRADPVNCLVIIHSDALPQKSLASIKQFSGYFIHYFPAFSEENFKQALFYFKRKNKIKLSKADTLLLWEISGGLPVIYKQAYLYSLKNCKFKEQGFKKKFIESSECENLCKGLLDNLRILPEYALNNLGLKNAQSKYCSQALEFYTKELNFESFTKTELKLLEYLKANQGIASNEEIANIIWDIDKNYRFSQEALDKHLSNLRKKVSSKKMGDIKNYKKLGYRYIAS